MFECIRTSGKKFWRHCSVSADLRWQIGVRRWTKDSGCRNTFVVGWGANAWYITSRAAANANPSIPLLQDHFHASDRDRVISAYNQNNRSTSQISGAQFAILNTRWVPRTLQPYKNTLKFKALKLQGPAQSDLKLISNYSHARDSKNHSLIY